MPVKTDASLPSRLAVQTHHARLRVLSLSMVYPNPREPGLGPFVRARLQHLQRAAQVKVIAPVAVTDYAAKRFRFVPPAQASRRDNQVEVFHPGWVYPPGGTPVNVLCLLGRIVTPVARIRKNFPFQVIDAHFGYPEGVVAAHLA